MLPTVHLKCEIKPEQMLLMSTWYFSKTEQYFLLLDKLLPDSVMAASRSEENVVLNNFQHKRCISVGDTLLILFGYDW